MNSSYDNKVVLVTGSSRGIGASTIEVFAKNKFNVVINYVNSESKALSLKEEVEAKYGVKALVVKADVSKEEEVKRLVDVTLSEFGHIDVLVNNAGIAIDTTLEDKTVDNFRKILDVNLIGTFLMCKYVGEVMMKQGYGSIVNISSTNGIDSYYAYSMDYDASKAGVISLTHNFANLYAPNIRVNSIAPGWVNTEMNKELGEDYINDECKHILLGRFAETYEIAEFIYYIGVEANYVNDAIIKVDGGRC